MIPTNTAIMRELLAIDDGSGKATESSSREEQYQQIFNAKNTKEKHGKDKK
jgi:hypothetical protein